ncbi:hybrid sensor histidine kinase/response regulator [Piscinibacter sp.]|uniref:ATP-binding response regulator n=1 Tax=Piscinibacter sp. TaxID=1903157 RepID=UPI002C8CCB5C|nr:hybrid sensor histidine kinase/response regulator [Albitalea sp.]HUG24032.1 hybrid sensor histidine kinase/response regulator [Albitalea sp.]
MLSTTHAPGLGIEILLVEDSPTQAARLRYLMESKGYLTRVANNGRDALRELRERRPQLVLSDVVMPEMDGYALCRAIKSDPALADTPVILVTSLVDPKDIVSGLECGADNFVRKPYADDYLLKRIQHVLMNKELRSTQGNHFELGIALYLGGQKHFINAERQQILDLLISTYEQAVCVNEELQAREQQISELNAHLARRAAELEVINVEIARKNLELQRASGMKSVFVANMSHELRTPLNAIMGFSEMLKDGLMGELSERQRKSAGAIFDSGMHLLSLINDILDLSRIEAGKMELELEKTDVAELLDNSVTMLKNRASAHQIRLNVESKVPDEICVDRRKARQIIYNLLSNAVKFTPDGGCVALHARRVEQPHWEGMQRVGETPLAQTPHGYLEIGVIDSGIGIAAEDLGRLFRPFAQLESGLSRKYEGSGLGLALVKQLVELHGGVLALRSRVGHGTTFKLWLPFREPARETAQLV